MEKPNPLHHGNHVKYLLTRYRQLAQQLISKKITPERFAREQTHAHLLLESKIEYDGLIDKFFNNNGFTKMLAWELKVLKRLNRCNGVLLALDIDYLKKFNDSQGHVAGDKLIKAYAQIIDQRTRSTDLKGRLGGDEFAVFLMDCNVENAARIAEQIRLSIIEKIKSIFPKLAWEQTISIGVAQVKEADDAQSLRTRADQALYKAKMNKNTVFIAKDQHISTAVITEVEPTLQNMDRRKWFPKLKNLLGR